MNIENLYQSLFRIRRAEEEVIRIYPSDKIKSPVHLSIGQEAVSVGVCEALQDGDVVFGTYRSHALYLAKTADLKGFFAELYGKATGCTKGKGGSMHLANIAKGMMGTSAIVATTIPQAIGYAYALKLRGEKAVVTVFFGDGATEEGVFHESLNFAALKKLPIIFICENNLFAINTPQHQRQSFTEICRIVQAHGIPAERIEGNDPLVIYDKVKNTAAAIRAGIQGPYFLECMTYRWKEHVGPDEDYTLGYREPQEVQNWKDQDSLNSVGQMISLQKRKEIEVEIERQISEAIEFAEISPYPEMEELYTDVFDNTMSENVDPIGLKTSGRQINYIDAIHEALDQEMGRDDSVVVFGLDVDDSKAIYGTTRGLPAKYGTQRVFGTPLAEDAMTGVAIGMAIAGLRPVHIHIRMDFVLLAMNQLVNIAAKLRYTFGDQVSVPVVVRAIIGRSWGQGPQHSQSFHSFFMHVPGLKVVAPSNPHDAKGCLIAAIRDNNPIVFVEHRLLQFETGFVPEQAYQVLPGKARITFEGSDITLVGISYMQLECVRARSHLESVNVNAEVIDPIWLSPLDLETIYTSVSKTRRLIIVDNGWATCGAAAEIAAHVAQYFEGHADIRIRRMGFEPVPCPTTPSLEKHFYPNPQSIAALAYKLVIGNDKDWIPSISPDHHTHEFKGPF
jgi:pyruvate/2-oxoglutarate/acetoin dehydrogenase E1 component/TPP-dependent pyruvate/acetoin dehydrogenase alpha subunit